MQKARPCAVMVVAAMALLAALAQADATPGKKLIKWGWDAPNTAYLLQHVEAWQDYPFDGLVLDVGHDPRAANRTDPRAAGKDLVQRVFTRQAFTLAEYQFAIDDLQRVRWGHFTDNFLSIGITPGEVDWFDDWSPVLAKAGVVARICREGGLKGLLFDTEQYGNTSIFEHGKRPRAAHKTFAQYQEQARLRGRQFMQALCAAKPDIAVFFTFAYPPRRPVDEDQYALLPAFLDGMLEGASAQARLVDGYEGSYICREPAAFADAYKGIVQDSRGVSAVPDLYAQHVRAAFGLWLDSEWSKNGWPNTEDFRRNRFTPRDWARAVAAALHYSDEYVWLWAEKADWWSQENLPAEYLQATRLGRAAPSRCRALETLAGRPVSPPPAADEAATEAWLQDCGLGSALSMLLRLRPQWEFSTTPRFGDVQDRSADLVYAPVTMDITRPWQTQGFGENGSGWYRTTFTLESVPAGRVDLLVGAADESAWVFVNGQLAGYFDQGIYGWDKPFLVEVADLLRPGVNQVVINVFDRVYAGGLWAPVWLVRESE